MVHYLRQSGITKKWLAAATCVLITGSGLNSAAAADEDILVDNLEPTVVVESDESIDLLNEFIDFPSDQLIDVMGDDLADDVVDENSAETMAAEDLLDPQQSSPILPPVNTNTYAGSDFTIANCRINGTEAPDSITGTVGKSYTVYCNFSPVPDSVMYVWYRNGLPWYFNQQTYPIDGMDVGTSIYAVARATKEGYNTLDVTSSNQINNIKYQFSYDCSQDSGHISGSTRVGQLLTANPPTCFSPTPTSYTYEWIRKTPGKDDDIIIPGATGKQYRLQAADIGKEIFVDGRVHHNNYHPMSFGSYLADGISVTLNSFTGGKVTISGTRNVGEPLKMNVSGFSPTPTEWQYQWYRGGVAIPGAIYSTYKPVAADAGKNIVGKVTVGKANYYNLTRSSAPVSILKWIKAGKVTISGPAKVGGKLAANPIGFSPTPSSYLYQWYRNGVKIAGATTKTYVPTKTDVGKKLTVQVTGKLAGYTNSPVAKSAATKAVIK